jgi:hypothetical protein
MIIAAAVEGCPERAEAAGALDSLHCISVRNLLNGIFVGGSKYLKEVT